MTPSPMLFRPILLEKVWGGGRLVKFGKRFKPTVKVGESWEIADLSESSPWGAGGGPQRSCVVNGGMNGLSLDYIVKRMGEDLLPRRMLTPRGGFPLLIKLLDAAENLSVQVHPSPAYAAANPGAHLKTECWHILDAAPGSVIYKGIKRGLPPNEAKEKFERAVRTEDWATMIEMIAAVPARAGECHILPSGIPHALGAGVIVAEVQTPSDTTFRLWDWGRTEREVQPEIALRSMDYGPVPKPVFHKPGTPCTLLAETPYFTLEAVTVHAGGSLPGASGGERCSAIIILEGNCVILHGEPGARKTKLPLSRGDTCLIPAAIGATAELKADVNCSMLRASPV